MVAHALAFGKQKVLRNPMFTQEN